MVPTSDLCMPLKVGTWALGLCWPQVAYPLSLLGASIKGMRSALDSLAKGMPPGPEVMGSFLEIQSAVGFPVSSRGLTAGS